MQNNRLKELRKKHNLTQKNVAQYLEIAQNSYSNYENGVREIPLETLIMLSRFYQVNLEYLIGLADDPTPFAPVITHISAD